MILSGISGARPQWLKFYPHWVAPMIRACQDPYFPLLKIIGASASPCGSVPWSGAGEGCGISRMMHERHLSIDTCRVACRASRTLLTFLRRGALFSWRRLTFGAEFGVTHSVSPPEYLSLPTSLHYLRHRASTLHMCVDCRERWAAWLVIGLPAPARPCTWTLYNVRPWESFRSRESTAPWGDTSRFCTCYRYVRMLMQVRLSRSVYTCYSLRNVLMGKYYSNKFTQESRYFRWSTLVYGNYIIIRFLSSAFFIVGYISTQTPFLINRYL